MWDQVSRSFHWNKERSKSDNVGKAQRRVIESNIALKRISTNGYFGTSGVYGDDDGPAYAYSMTEGKVNPLY